MAVRDVVNHFLSFRQFTSGVKDSLVRHYRQIDDWRYMIYVVERLVADKEKIIG